MEQEAHETRMCLCGYDLTGLAGPPWICPECNETWTPPKPINAAQNPFTRAERWQIGIGMTLFQLSPLFVALSHQWSTSLAIRLLPSILTISLVALPVTTRWLRGDRQAEGDQYDRSTEPPRAVMLFIAAWIGSAVVGVAIFFAIQILLGIFIIIAVGWR